jgi:molecular chaperone GrpE
MDDVNDGSQNENTEPKADQSAEDVLAQCRAEADKFKTEFLYQRAEFENFKKQAIKERSDLRKFGAERLAVDLLNVLDIFETALATELTPENMHTFRRGIEMTANELRAVLNRNGVEEIPAQGAPFDPAVHEALSSESLDDVEPGTITRVFKKPYKLHDRVIRPGQVVVAKKP